MSLFTYQPAERNIKGFAGREHRVPLYLQFVTGYCAEVMHEKENPFHEADNHTNSIYAIAHQTDKIFKTQSTPYSEDDRYYPLLRSVHDVPSKGDTVLLTNLNGINYYLGPLNMNTNSPTWNDNPLNGIELASTDNKGTTTERGKRGESKNFNKDLLWARLTKKRKEELDYGNVLKETTGDTLIEGRHGNSLRIGSRNIYPYIFISNQRGFRNTTETIGDGSLISITSNGSLRQHFDTLVDEDGNDVQFGLSSDSTDNTYPIGDIYSDLNGNADSDDLIYNYSLSEEGTPNLENQNQILFQSDRITINTKTDDIFLSSIKDTYIGSVRNIAISSGRELDLISSTVSIGNPYRGPEMQPMVLGQTLTEVLNEMLALIENLEIFTGQMGVQTPLMSPTSAVFKKKVTGISDKIKNITSNFHEIEGN